MKPSRNLFLGSFLIIALSQAAQALDYTWNGTTSGTWNTTGTNWMGSPTDPWTSANGASNSATLNLASLAATVSGTVYTNGITFTQGGSLTGGTAINLDGTGAFVNVAASQTGTVTTDIAGDNGLLKLGDGILSFGTAKTFTGGVQVDAGTLRFTTNGGVGNNTITMGAASGSVNTVLDWANNSTATSGSGVVINGTGGTKTLQATTGVTGSISSLTLKGNVTKANGGTLNVTNATTLDGGSRTITVSSGTLALNGAVGQTATGYGITKAGGGLLILSNSNTFTGAVSFSDNSSGQIRVTNSGAFGTGTKTVSATVGSGARIELDGTAGALSFASGIQFSLSGSTLRNTAGDNIINGTIGAALGAGNGIVESNAGTLTLAGTVRAVNSGNRTLQIQGTSTGANTISGQIIDGTSIFSLNKQGTGTWIINSTTNTNNYTGTTTVGQGVLNIRSSNALGATVAGTSVSSGAALEIQGGITTAAEALSLSGTGLSNGGALRNISGTNTYAGAITLATASRINSDAGTLNLNVTSGNAITSTDLGVTFGGAGDITVSDAIALGTAGVIKDGAGILTYNANNTYTGTTTVNGGLLVMQANQSNNGDVIINDTGSIKMSTARTFKLGTNVAVNTGGTWLLDGTSQTVGQLTGAGIIDQGWTSAGTDTLTVGSGDVSSTFGGVIREAAVVTSRVIALTKTGSGTLTLTGTNSHGGTTSVSGGILRISNASALGDTTAGTNITGGTATSRLELSGGISFAAEGVTLAGRSTNAVHLSNLSGNNTWNGNISTDAGGNIYNIESQADKLTIAGGISVNQSGSRILNLTGAGDGEVTGVISGSGSNTAALTKLGLGTWTLTNTNTYSGDTTINAGTLALSGSGSINHSAVIDVQTGTTLSIAGVTTSATIGSATAQTLKGLGSVDLGSKTLTVGNSGTLAPGASPGTLDFIASVGGKLDFSSGSIIAFELGTTSDLISFNSAGDWLTGSGNATLALSLLAGFDYDNTYTIFENVSTTGFTLASITGYDNVGYTANFA